MKIRMNLNETNPTSLPNQLPDLQAMYNIIMSYQTPLLFHDCDAAFDVARKSFTEVFSSLVLARVLE